MQYAHIGESDLHQLEWIYHEVRCGPAQPIALQLISQLLLQQRRVLDSVDANYIVHIVQMGHSSGVCNSPYNASHAGERGKPSVKLPASSLFLIAPLPPSCERYALSNCARNKCRNLDVRKTQVFQTEL